MEKKVLNEKGNKSVQVAVLDEKDNEDYKDILEGLGVTAFITPKFADFMEFIEENKPKMILLGYFFRVMYYIPFFIRGEEVSMWLKEKPKYADVPICLVTFGKPFLSHDETRYIENKCKVDKIFDRFDIYDMYSELAYYIRDYFQV